MDERSARRDDPSNWRVRVGVFDRMPAADAAVSALVDAGYDPGSISVICPTCGDHDIPGVQHQDPAGEHTPGRLAVGGTIGAVFGGLVAAAGVAATGGVGLLVAGPLLAGAAGGALAGGFIGAMTTRGIEPEIADYYDQALRRGQILVAVESTGSDPAHELAQAEKVFLAAGADPVELPRG